MSASRYKPLIIPIFIPHLGCPHRCVFCEQESITSQPKQRVGRTHVEQVLKKAIHSNGFDAQRRPEVAFYGGTFTNLPTGLIQELLDAVAPFMEQGNICRIRVSTRPDALDEERLKIMKDKGVSIVELGAQSMDNTVLRLSERGHTAEDTVNAVHILKHWGFSVGMQLMPGLPGDSGDSFYSTVTQVIELMPDMVRLYPALVIKGTRLATLFAGGHYQPLKLDDAIRLCMESCVRLESQGIPVIRIGLMSSPSLLEEGRIIAGPWHTAFGFLVRAAIYQKKIEPFLPAQGKSAHIRIRVPSRDIPLIRGYKNQGLRHIKDRTGAKVVEVDVDNRLADGTVMVEKI